MGQRLISALPSRLAVTNSRESPFLAGSWLDFNANWHALGRANGASELSVQAGPDFTQGRLRRDAPGYASAVRLTDPGFRPRARRQASCFHSRRERKSIFSRTR